VVPRSSAVSNVTVPWFESLATAATSVNWLDFGKPGFSEDLDEAVESESHECNAASDYARHNSNHALDGIPPNGEVFESSPSTHERHAV
jgi:hypothetical protein